jgi:hypothetical protein
MAGSNSFQGLRLRGGFLIVHVEFVIEPLVDAMGRPALAKTQIVGRGFHLTVLSGLSDNEKSVTLYHEVLEAKTVASSEAPASVRDFNEGDFERAAYEAHERFGPVSPEGMNSMLQFYGFREE